MGKKTNIKARTSAQGKKLKIAGVILGLLLIIGGVRYSSWKKARDAKTAAVAQEQKKDQGDTSKSSTSSGGVVDNNANASATKTTQSSATPSSTTTIVLTSPTTDSLVVNGTLLDGKATTATVQYRFKDSDGLDVATGALTVSGGKFSGSAAGLNARTSTGTLEVYNYNSNGAEENWVKINVRYK